MTKVGILMAGAAALLSSALWISGCGDDVEPLGPTPVPTADADGAGDMPTPDIVMPDTAHDTATPPVDTGNPVPDVGDAATTPDAEVAADGPAPDTTAPEVVATSPAQSQDGVSFPFVVTLTFSEPIYAATLKTGPGGSISMSDHLGFDVPLELSLSQDSTIATLTPLPADGVWAHASPYEVRLAPNIIADLAGNKLAMPYILRFFTQGYPNTGFYKGLAESYAPRFHIETTGADPRRRVPTRVDADGNWDTSDSLAWISASAAIDPVVYYNVSETYSHYFIHYMAYFPHVATGTSAAHGNGTVGSMVTVKKSVAAVPTQPLSVTTYWRTKASEENDVYATAESGFMGGGDLDFYRLRAVMAQETLFGDDGHYDAYVSGTYESCIWTHEETGGFATCKLYEALKSTMTWLVFEATSGAVDPLVPMEEGGWPMSMADIEGKEALGYELVSLADTLWPRRLEDGNGQIWGDTYAYSNPSRPADGMVISSRFVDPVDDISPPYGRPVWAWKYVPSQGEPAGIKQGWLGVDPAFYAHKRHSSVNGDNVFVDWNAEASTGFSLDYCFNALAMIDVRETDPGCGP